MGWKIIAVIVAINSWSAYGKLLVSTSDLENYMGMATGYASQVLYVGLAFKDSLGKKLLAVIAILTSLTLCDTLMLVVLRLPEPDIPIRDMDSLGYMFAMLIFNILAVIAIHLLAVIWKFFSKIKRFQLQNLLFIMLPVGQLLMLSILNWNIGIFATEGNYASLVYWTISIVLSIITSIVLYRLTKEQTMKRNAQLQLQQVEYLRQLEEAKYHAIEQKNQEMAKIRHDYKNQLIAIEHLVEEQQMEHAREVLKEMTEKLDSLDTEATAGKL